MKAPDGNEPRYWLRVAMIALLVASPFLFYFGARIHSAMYLHGYTLAEMDWDEDGRTSFSEVVMGSDVGSRPLPANSDCTEYFTYKDTHRLKVVCAGSEPEAGTK